jgi:hypothetical protein
MNIQVESLKPIADLFLCDDVNERLPGKMLLVR